MFLKKNSMNSKAKGFSLLDVIVASMVVTITIISITGFFTYLFKEIGTNRERITQTSVAMSRLEEWRSLPHKAITPNMQFQYFKRTMDQNTGLIVFSTHTLTIPSVNRINLTTLAKTTSPGYNYLFNLPSGGNMFGGEDFVNNVWYDGPDATPGNNTPGLIRLNLTCVPGVTGILTIRVLDYNNKQREEKVSVNGIVIKKFPAGSFRTTAPLANRTIIYTLTQQHTATGTVNIEIKQTSAANQPTNGGLNPNCVLSEVKFDILAGYTEHDSYEPYTVVSEIIPTYNMADIIPGWQIMVTVKKDQFRPTFLATTIAQ
jgi:Tfp pilus assembly protein PilV